MDVDDGSAPPEPTPPATWRERVELLTSGFPGAGPPLRTLAVGGAAVAALVVAVVLLLRSPAGSPPELSLPVAGSASEPAGPTTSTSAAPTEVVAHAAGAVARPGVFTLAAGARVADLVEAAGGAVAGAELDRVNLAAPVVDGERVYVPLEGEVAPPPVEGGAAATTGSSTASVANGPLDLNAATAAELEELPGVGPATSAAILEERERRGAFASVEELLDVRGIGEAKLDQLRDLVTV